MRKDIARRHQILLMILGAMLLLVLLTSSACVCEQIAPITIQNKTDQNLAIVINGLNIGDVAPGGELRNRREMIEARFMIEAKNAQGETVYKQEITYEDMEDMDWTVVIPPPSE